MKMYEIHRKFSFWCQNWIGMISTMALNGKWAASRLKRKEVGDLYDAFIFLVYRTQVVFHTNFELFVRYIIAGYEYVANESVV